MKKFNFCRSILCLEIICWNSFIIVIVFLRVYAWVFNIRAAHGPILKYSMVKPTHTPNASSLSRCGLLSSALDYKTPSIFNQNKKKLFLLGPLSVILSFFFLKERKQFVVLKCSLMASNEATENDAFSTVKLTYTQTILSRRGPVGSELAYRTAISDSVF